MQNISKRNFSKNLFAILLGANFAPNLSQALSIVYDPTAVARLIDQLSKQIQQIQIAQQQLQDMAINSATLPAQYWGQTMQNINRVNQLLNDAKSLSYQGNNIEQQIKARYQGYANYSGSGSTNIQGKYQQWSEVTSSSIASTLKALGLQNSQFEDEDALLRQLEQMGKTSQGRMQAAQIGNQLAMQGVRQTQKLRQIMMAQTQMQANYFAQLQDKADLKAAGSSRFHQKSNFATKGGKTY